MSAAEKLASVEKKQKNNSTNSQSIIKNRQSNEIIIGLCGPIGSGINDVSSTTKNTLKENGYTVIEIKISAQLIKYSKDICNELGINHDDLEHFRGFQRIDSLQKIGNRLRELHGNEFAAELTTEAISVNRELHLKENPAIQNPRIAYIINQLKHPSEVDLLRLIYPQIFYLVGVLRYSEERKNSLSELDISASDIDTLINRDHKEDFKYGQQIEKTLLCADFFIRNKNSHQGALNSTITRFISIIHGANGITPTTDEFGMYSAFSASMGSACLSRQVGASILDKTGKLLAAGCNDVPKAQGGRYTADDKEHDYRCVFKGEKCYNDFYKEKLREQLEALLNESTELTRVEATQISTLMSNNTQIKSLIEYSRAVHAEMDAIISLSRSNSSSTVGTTLYSTTYPCHNCARHIIAAGISRVVYIEPYEKSLAVKLHDDAICSVGIDNTKVMFETFEGVAPRRFNRFFTSNAKRKDDNGKAIVNKLLNAPQVDPQYLDSYNDYEAKVSENLQKKLKNKRIEAVNDSK